MKLGMLKGIAIAGTLLLGTGLAGAEDKAGAPKKGDKMGGDQAAMMQAMHKAAAPGPQHESLKSLAGAWNAQVKMWMAPGAQPTESKATADSKAILGGRFVQEEFKGAMMGQPFTGMSTTGYDNVEKKYMSSWIDSMGTGMMLMTGTADASGKVITMTGQMNDPMGQKQNLRTVTKIDSDKKHTFEMYMVGPGGKEFKTMEITYTRK